jgi:glycosyltransferase involved in cell wall biosynthesis
MKNYAVVHEWLTPQATGGSELVVEEILKHIEADLYSLIDFESCNPESYLFGRDIGTSFLQYFPGAKKGIQKYLPLLPLAIEQFDLRNYRTVISSSHAVAKGILTTPEQLHICYCHTPMRYAWDLTFDYLQGSRLGWGLPGVFTRYLLHGLRQWDVISANRVDFFVANSQHTARRIWRCYRREAKVIYPPVNLERFPLQTQKEDFYLTVCRLVSYKKVSLIVEAFNQLGKPLVVIGTGPELEQIKQLAQPNVQILGKQSDEVVEEYMSRAKAFVYAACEDFGIALVEAQSCGTPVVAYGQGGARETVLDVRDFPDKATGVLFGEQSCQAIVEAIAYFEAIQPKISTHACHQQGIKFATHQFKTQFLTFIENCQQK